MPTYKLRGIDVDFPFEAYDCQLVYMEKVIEALQRRCNALLESPTGTGKTLCLLCATLAWRKSLGGFSTGSSKIKSGAFGSQSDVRSSQSEAGNLPTIVYTSRTHSQLRQVIQELRRSNYRPKMVVLGSREQLCIHEEVSLLRGKAQTNACRSLCRKDWKRRCTHFPHVADYMKNNPHIGDEPIDIEDLVNIGRKHGPCPYYVSRELHKAVDILFSPYNYLIDREYRKSLSLEWHNSILIFDEAHNLVRGKLKFVTGIYVPTDLIVYFLPSVGFSLATDFMGNLMQESICADAASFDLSSGLLTACISEAKNCADLAVGRQEESYDKSWNPDNFAILRALLLKLQKRIAEVPIESKELGFTKPGPYIYELLADLNITHETATKLIDIIEDATLLLEEDKKHDTKGSGCKLESIGNILKSIFTDKGNRHADSYRVHVQEAEVKATDILKGGQVNWKRFVWSGMAPPRVETFLWEPMEQFLRLWDISSVLPKDPISLLCSWSDLRPNSQIWSFISGVVLWSVWKARNLVVFENWKLDVSTLSFICRFRLAKWFLAKHPNVIIQVDSLVGDPTIVDKLQIKAPNKLKFQDWRPPPVHFFKVNVDGAISGDGLLGGIGGILRDLNSKVLGSFSSVVGPGPPPLAELKAMEKGIDFFLLSEWAMKGRLILESDCKAVVDWILQPTSSPFFSSMVEKIVSIVLDRQIIVRHISRRCNCEANSLAKQGIG
ncbi:pentatricopeptide repeat-containing protein [Hibiscus syriacus]|uniref:Pentatricopeptide repeat-containing protein n=1 Tax=Hibiscus syriacus TaxID=106335 RepID=A0A6A3CAP2_HIBSY|nr:pentatricopeptide repeat-containing protein [Hibiscus syriacus]